MTLRHPLTIVLLTLMLLAGCGGRATTITIKSQGMRFVRDELRLQAGQPVTLRLVNTDGFAHSFDLDEFDIHIPLAAQETVEITFTPSEIGSYTYYCGAPGHTSAGMIGALIVEP